VSEDAPLTLEQRVARAIRGVEFSESITIRWPADLKRFLVDEIHAGAREAEERLREEVSNAVLAASVRADELAKANAENQKLRLRIAELEGILKSLSAIKEPKKGIL